MNFKKLTLSATVAGGLLLSAASSAFAAPIIAQTWVSGTVFDESHNPVNGGSVNVTCGAASQSVSVGSDGSYGAVFNQSDCHVGDTASAVANTADGSGSSSGTVQNTAINGPTVDLDISVLDITVPEFGLVGGVLSAAGASAAYFYFRAKQLVS